VNRVQTNRVNVLLAGCDVDPALIDSPIPFQPVDLDAPVPYALVQDAAVRSDSPIRHDLLDAPDPLCIGDLVLVTGGARRGSIGTVRKVTISTQRRAAWVLVWLVEERRFVQVLRGDVTVARQR